MSRIIDLTEFDTVSSGDNIPVFIQSVGDARKVALSVIATFLQTQITSTDNKITQYAAPSATGFNVIINGSGVPAYNSSVWLILTPVASYATGTITLPPVATCADRQEILVNTTQAVTTLTIAANGATVTGAPTTLTAGGKFRLRFDGVTGTWYCV